MCYKLLQKKQYLNSQIRILTEQRVSIIKYISNPRVIYVPKTVYDELEEVSQSITRYQRKLELIQYQYDICLLENIYIE